MTIKVFTGMEGWYKARTVCAMTGRIREVMPWHKNVLLNSGFEAMGLVDNWMDYCQVGASSILPSATDTGLYSWIAGSSNRIETITGATASAPFYGFKQVTTRFGVGVAAGNISELGMGWDMTGATLISRQRAVDGVGTPTTFQVLPTEYLDVTFQMRYYSPTVDVAPVDPVSIGGSNFYTITRASRVNDGGAWGENIGRIMTGIADDNGSWSAYDGDIGTTEQAPSGTQAQCDNTSAFNDPYQNNSKQQVCGIVCGGAGWNLAGGIRSLRFKTTAGEWQTQFGDVPGATGAKIQKTNQETMPARVLIGWGARP